MGTQPSMDVEKLDCRACCWPQHPLEVQWSRNVGPLHPTRPCSHVAYSCAYGTSRHRVFFSFLETAWISSSNNYLPMRDSLWSHLEWLGRTLLRSPLISVIFIFQNVFAIEYVRNIVVELWEPDVGSWKNALDLTKQMWSTYACCFISLSISLYFRSFAFPSPPIWNSHLTLT